MASPQTLQPNDSDCFAYAAGPTQNFNNLLQAGVYGSGDLRHGWFKFNALSDGTIPSTAIVISAVLTLTSLDDYATASETISVYRVKRAWVGAQATWNIYSTGNNWQTAGGTGANDYDSTALGSFAMGAAETSGTAHNITLNAAAIQEMISGAFANNGFMIKSPDVTLNTLYVYAAHGDATASYRPKLVITYTFEAIGTLSKTLDALTSVSAGKTEIAGTLSGTLGALTGVSAGLSEIRGILAITLGPVIAGGAGLVADVFGVLAQTLGALILVSEGGSPAVGIEATDVSYDIELIRGEDSVFTFTYKDDNGQVLPLTGHLVRMDIRKAHGGDILCSLTESDGIVISHSLGLITLTITHAKSIAFEFINARYDLWIETGNGIRIPISYGKITIIENITEFVL